MNEKDRSIQFHNNLIIFGLIVLILFAFILPVNAATLTWSGGGNDNLASNADNWMGTTVPLDGDDIVLNSTYVKDCTWNINVSPASLIINSGYTGAFTLNSDLTVRGSVDISGGTVQLNSGNLLVGFSMPTVTTDSAISSNGTSATLNAIVNPNGLDTTVYFEWGTDTSYGFAGIAQLIGSGIVDVNVSDYISGLVPNTTYHFRVVVINDSDTYYGDDMSFTTPMIALTINSPSDSDTINRPDTLVTGTVINASGNETGVIVNGIVAVVYNGEFFVNHVPLDEGQNTITANSVDTDGNSATTEITIDAITTAPHVILQANLESGIAPLSTYFSVSTVLSDSVTKYELDYNGDSVIDYRENTFKNVSFTYATEGIYYSTITVMTDQGDTFPTYTDTIAIIVLNQTELDTLLKAKWNTMTTALLNQNVEGALLYFTETSKKMFRYNFELMQSILPVIVQDMTDITMKQIEGGLAEYEMITIQNSTEYSHYIEFVIDSDGIWKISFF